MGVREASPSSTKSYRFLEFQLVRLAWSTPAFCIVDDCAFGFVPKTPDFPTLTSCDFLTKALPQPFRRKGSLLSKEQTSNIYCCLSWEGHGPRKNLRNAREKSVFTARVLKTRPPPWTGSFRGLQRTLWSLYVFKRWAHWLVLCMLPYYHVSATYTISATSRTTAQSNWSFH